MFKNKKSIFVVAGSLLALVAIGVASFVYANSASASSLPVARLAFGQGGFDHGGRGDFPGGDRPGRGGPDDTYLAEALGITVEELQAAQSAAWEKAVDQALEAGLITEAQAETLKERSAAPGRRGGGMMLGEWMGKESGLDMNALLAEQLGISVDELDAARQKADELRLQAAIDSGEITAEQAEMMKARQALKDYIDREALLAQVLGVSVEELQAAHQEGKSPADLIQEKGLTEEEVQAAMKTAFEAALKQAVTDGVITQAQADQMLENQAEFGRGGFPGKGGRPDFGPGGRPFPGGPGGDCPPQALPDASTNNG
jgi:hypothetical protein